jgi:hypothetical protein
VNNRSDRQVRALTRQLSHALNRIAALEAQVEQLPTPGQTAWPTPDTAVQGFLAGRWQRRDGNIYTQPLANIPEAPSDSNYYGRYQGTWQPVVEEAPGLTARRSTYGWARASAGSDITWISLDDILANFQPAGNYAPAGNYLDKAGGQMTGPLISRDGGSAVNPGLAIGDNTTGFYKGGSQLLVTTVGGVIVMQIQPAIGAFFVPVNFTGKPLNAVGDPVLADDALNLRTADGRYAPVASARARPVVYDIPADIDIPGSGVWTPIATIPCTLPPRPGVTSLLMVSVNCNLKGVNNVNGIGARVAISPSPELRLFGFGPNGTDPSAGFSANLFVSPATGATAFNVPVQLNAFNIGSTVGAYTVVGGNAILPDRSQIVIIDLGPVS